MNESNSVSSSTILRPRNRRRTRESEDGETPTAPTTFNFLDGPSPSVSSSRAPSPLPKARPSQTTRPPRESERPHSSSGFLNVPGALGSQTSSSSFATNLWESSWASLQGIASNLMGSESSRTTTPNRSPTRRRQQYDGLFSVRNTSAPPAQWGPSGNAEKRVAAGTKDDRRAQVQAKKREALLASNGQMGTDITGHYKRRDSDDRGPGATENEERDALVYLHKVKPDDTMAGVTIKYGCQPTVFRKANRLWPNDKIQIRKIVVVPIDACTVRGRKVPAPSKEATPDPQMEENSIEEVTPIPTNLQSHDKRSNEATNQLPTQTPLSSIPTSPSISFALSNPEEAPWTHDSWVQIDGFTDPVEIARLSRKALGFFPRRRRKSLSFSDLGTPSASFDLPRPSYQSTRGSSPGRRPSIRGSKSRSSSASQFAKSLHGPGGVGTMSFNVRSPGPAQDGLNKMFAAHLPNLAPKSSFESLSLATSSHTHNTGGGGAGGIENIGGAIEGWMRKVATKASTSMQQSSASGTGLGTGDLIELSEDAFEIGEEDEGVHQSGSGGRGRDRARGGDDQSDGVPPTTAATKGGRTNLITGWTAEQQDQMLHERFPPRGRVFADNSRKSGARSSR